MTSKSISLPRPHFLTPETLFPTNPLLAIFNRMPQVGNENKKGSEKFNSKQNFKIPKLKHFVMIKDAVYNDDIEVMNNLIQSKYDRTASVRKFQPFSESPPGSFLRPTRPPVRWALPTAPTSAALPSFLLQ